MVKAVPVASEEPPEEAAYHSGLVPLVAKLATVGLVAEQKVWGLVGVGAAGVVCTVTATAVLRALSHPLTV